MNRLKKHNLEKAIEQHPNCPASTTSFWTKEIVCYFTSITCLYKDKRECKDYMSYIKHRAGYKE